MVAENSKDTAPFCSFAAVEPVFGSTPNNNHLDRFTLGVRKKVDGQWKLYCLVHNIEKLAHHGYAGGAEKSGKTADYA